MLRVVRVPVDHPNSYAHEVGEEFNYSISTKKKMCVLTLSSQYANDGGVQIGKCSKICKHGYLVCTEDFTVNFPILIEGGLSDATHGQEEEVKGQS